MAKSQTHKIVKSQNLTDFLRLRLIFSHVKSIYISETIHKVLRSNNNLKPLNWIETKAEKIVELKKEEEAESKRKKSIPADEKKKDRLKVLKEKENCKSGEKIPPKLESLFEEKEEEEQDDVSCFFIP